MKWGWTTFLQLVITGYDNTEPQKIVSHHQFWKYGQRLRILITNFQLFIKLLFQARPFVCKREPHVKRFVFDRLCFLQFFLFTQCLLLHCVAEKCVAICTWTNVKHTKNVNVPIRVRPPTNIHKVNLPINNNNKNSLKWDTWKIVWSRRLALSNFLWHFFFVSMGGALN